MVVSARTLLTVGYVLMSRILLVVVALAPLWLVARPEPPPTKQIRDLDPAGWGEDHVSQPVPDFLSQEECLFCHRGEIGSNWDRSWHNKSIRAVDPDSAEIQALMEHGSTKALAAQVTWLLGGRFRTRYLRPSADFGRAEILSTSRTAQGTLVGTNDPRWDSRRFADSCAGCHASGVDSRSRTYASLSLECYVCHGLVPEDHTRNASSVHLSPRRVESSRVVISICAQCHARGGRSRSTGLPFPTNFVAGDNLFRDFAINLKNQAGDRPEAAEAHVFATIRQVVVSGDDDLTCITCHDVHRSSTRKHQRLKESSLCRVCHEPGRLEQLREGVRRSPTQIHHAICEY